jgi:hypothetical protein
MAVETAPGGTLEPGLVFFNPAQAGFGNRSRDFNRRHPDM